MGGRERERERERERRHSDANWRENGRAGSNEERAQWKAIRVIYERGPRPTTISIHMDKLIQDVALYTYIRITMRKTPLLQRGVDSMGNVARCRARVVRTAAENRDRHFRRRTVRSRVTSNQRFEGVLKLFQIRTICRVNDSKLLYITILYSFFFLSLSLSFFQGEIDNIRNCSNWDKRVEHGHFVEESWVGWYLSWVDSYFPRSDNFVTGKQTGRL